MIIKNVKVLVTGLGIIGMNGSTTVKALVDELNKKYSTDSWSQKDVTDVLNNEVSNPTLLKCLTLKDGNYVIEGYDGVIAETPLEALPEGTVTKDMSRTKIMELMRDSKGKFLTVTFKKKDGTIRTMNCKVKKGTSLTSLGYLPVTETKSKLIKNVDPRELIRVKYSSVVYQAS